MGVPVVDAVVKSIVFGAVEAGAAVDAANVLDDVLRASASEHDRNTNNQADILSSTRKIEK
jgi:hypothetical protein